MKVLVIGREPNLFNEESEAFKRIREYAGLFKELHIVSGEREKREPRRYGNLFLWPAVSRISLLRFWQVLQLGKAIARKYRPQVIDAQDSGEWGLVAYLVARGSRIPLRLQIHTDVFSQYYRRASWKERIRYTLARFLVPRADCIRVVSHRIKQSLWRTKLSTFCGELSSPHSTQKITILPIFTDISKFQNAAKDPQTEERFKDYDFKMIAVGRFVDKEKNFSMLIKIMRDFIKICPKALLVIVGYGPDKKKYLQMVQKYKLKKNVIIDSEGEVKSFLFTPTERTNYVERSEDIIEPWRDDLPTFYKSFDLFLLSSNYEGWGRTVVEAMACGLPVVMTDVGLAGEVLLDGENGYVVPVGDTEAMIRAIKKLYEDPEIRRKFAAVGQSTARSLRPATKEEYLTLYKESISRCSF